MAAAGGAITQVNDNIPGELRVTLALPATTFPAGELQLARVALRARSVPADLVTQIGLVVGDVSDSEGSQFNYGTDAAGTEVGIQRREFTGDINTNGRLDTGDAFLLQRLLTGLDEPRAWDHELNDLNGTSLIDSGDVVRILRTIVGLDAQPGAKKKGGGGDAPAKKPRRADRRSF